MGFTMEYCKEPKKDSTTKSMIITIYHNWTSHISYNPNFLVSFITKIIKYWKCLYKIKVEALIKNKTKVVATKKSTLTQNVVVNMVVIVTT